MTEKTSQKTPRALALSTSQPSTKIASPLQVTNRYQVLGNIPRPNFSYSSTLATPAEFGPSSSQYLVNDPFAPQPIQQITKTKFYNHPTRTDYVLKPKFSNLFSIEPNHNHIKNPIDLIKNYFPPSWHFTPHHPAKTLKFYMDILYSSESVRIKAITDRNDSSRILYHSLHINNIISLQDWGSHPSILKSLPSHQIQFSYYDYIEAWFKVLLYQNESFTHSWFLCFDQKFKSQIPS